MARTAIVSGVVMVVTAAASFALFSEDDPIPEAAGVQTTTTSTFANLPDAPTYVATNEIPLGPAVLAPTEFEIDGEDAALRFDLHHLAPVANEPTGWVFQPFRGWNVRPAEELATVFPDQWTLILADQEIPGQVANIEASAARFKVPDGTTEADVTAIRIDRYRVLYPVDIPFTIGVDESVEILDGVTATVLQVIDQVDSTIVRIEVVTVGDIDLSHADIRGVGPGWQSAVRDVGGGDIWSLTNEGSFSLPVQLTLRGSIWLDVDAGFSFTIGGADG